MDKIRQQDREALIKEMVAEEDNFVAIACGYQYFMFRLGVEQDYYSQDYAYITGDWVQSIVKKQGLEYEIKKLERKKERLNGTIPKLQKKKKELEKFIKQYGVTVEKRVTVTKNEAES